MQAALRYIYFQVYHRVIVTSTKSEKHRYVQHHGFRQIQTQVPKIRCRSDNYFAIVIHFMAIPNCSAYYLLYVTYN